MEQFLDRWAKQLDWLLSSKPFETIFGIVMMSTAAAHLPQLWKAVTATSVEGISIEMYLWLIFASIVGSLYGVKQKDPLILFPMAAACVVYITIVSVVLTRGGTFILW